VHSYTTLPEEETRAAILAHQPDPPSRPQEPEGTPSMTQDLLAGRPMEADQVFTDLVARAAAAGIAVPHIQLVRDLICGLNRILAS
jgi:ketopantoate reductase